MSFPSYFYPNVTGSLIATYILLIVWVLLLIIKYFVNLFDTPSQYNPVKLDKHQPPVPLGPNERIAQINKADHENQNMHNDQTQGINSEHGYYGESKLSIRLSRGASVARMGFILLLASTVVSALSFQPTTACLVLSWIFFSLIILWTLVTIITSSRWVPAILGLFSFPIVIAMYGVGFTQNYIV